MKNIFAALILATVSGPLFADVLNRVEQCYRNNGDTRAASYCAAQALGLEIRQMQGGNVQPPPPPPPPPPPMGAGIVLYCDQAEDPQLHKLVLDLGGRVLSDTVLATFSDGDDDKERRDCMSQVGPQPVDTLRSFKSSCVCTSVEDPVLTLTLMNRRGQAIRTIGLGAFSTGGDAQEMAACQATINSSPICHL